MMMRINLGIILILLLLPGGVMALDGGRKPVLMDAAFFSGFNALLPLKRDFFLDGKLGLIVKAQGQVEEINDKGRFGRKYRIIVRCTESKAINVLYHVHTDDPVYLKQLKKGDSFSFAGILKMYTPLSTQRESYICDILLSDKKEEAD